MAVQAGQFLVDGAFVREDRHLLRHALWVNRLQVPLGQPPLKPLAIAFRYGGRNLRNLSGQDFRLVQVGFQISRQSGSFALPHALQL